MNATNIAVFKQTIDTYKTKYKNATTELCTKGTKIYRSIDEPWLEIRDSHIEVINGDTVETGRKFACDSDKTTAILNFADALTPGGLVWSGASTQEEHICRCSNLYASLTTPQANERYYKINSVFLPSGVYTDNIIYSTDVLFFRSGKDYRFLDDPYTMDVITCPAPSARLSAKNAQSIIFNRVDEIVKSAIINNVDNLILGAWGCGAFGQNPEIVAKAFRKSLKKYPAFDNVIFAIRSCRADYATKTTDNYSVFKEVLSAGEN